MEIGTLTATASYKGKVMGGSATIFQYPKSLHLNFLRYISLRDNGSYSVFRYPESNYPKKTACERMPAVDRHTTSLFGLDEGYIYVLFEEKPSLFLELSVSYAGMQKIEWTEKDYQSGRMRFARPRSTMMRFLPVDFNAGELSIAYSRFQWPMEYITKIRGDKSFREARMQKFDTRKYMNDEAQSDVYTIDTVQVSFPVGPKDKWPYNCRPGWVTNFKENTDCTIYFGKWLTGYHEALSKHKCCLEENERSVEIFMGLDDPMGCADWLATEVERSTAKLHRVLKSLQSDEDNEASKEVNMMYLHSLMFYKMFHSPQASEKVRKLGENIVSQAALEDLLLHSQRKRVRDEINAGRKNLFTFWKSDYYQKALAEIEFMKREDQPQSVAVVNTHLFSFANCPHNFDRHISLVHDKDCERLDAEIQGYIKKMLEDDSHPFMRMYTNDITIDLVWDAGSMYNISTGMLNLLSSIQDDVFSTVKIVYRKVLSKYRIQSWTASGEAPIQLLVMEKQSLNDLLHSLGVKPDRHYGPGIKGHSAVAVNAQFDDCIVFNAPEGLKGQFKIRFERFMNHGATLAMKGLLSVWNCAYTIAMNGEVGGVKGVINITASLSLGFELLSFTTSQMAKSTPLLSFNAVRAISQLTGAAATAAFGVQNIAVGVAKLQNRDIDAGLLYMCSGAAFIASATLTIYATWKGVSIATVIIAGVKLSWATLLFCVGFALLLFAIWFADTPFECYLKNMILARNGITDEVLKLGRRRKFVGSKLMKLILANRNEIVSDKWSKFRDLQASYDELTSLLYSINIQPEYTGYYLMSWGMRSEVSELKSITISVPYLYLRLKSTLDLKMVQYIGYNRHETPCVIPIGEETIMSAWGETSFRYDDKAQLLHVKIQGNILESLYWGVESHNYGKCYLCARVISEVKYTDESRDSESQITMPYGDKYMINRVRVTECEVDDMKIMGDVPAAHMTIAINQSSFKTYLDYLMRDTKLTLSLAELDNAKRTKRPEQ